MGKLKDFEVPKHRLQLDFTEQALDDLDKLKDSSGLPNRAEVIRHALRLMQWTINETQNNGSTLLIENGGKQREVVIPLSNALKAVIEKKGRVQ